MKKALASSQKVMKNYLSELMTDDLLVDKTTETSVENKKLEKLLQNVSVDLNTGLHTEKSINTTKVSIDSKVTKSVVSTAPKEIKSISNQTEKALQTVKSRNKATNKLAKEYRQGDFQAMFFEVAGLTLAVPLIELGGIHQIDKITSLMGKPDWFKGVMLYREEKINVVDTALWVMPEKCDEELKNSLNYQYIIMLSDSQWGLSAENLVDTVTLSQDDVKWLDSPNKRPWLAGLVKNRMCALLNVDELISLLDNGCGMVGNI